MRHVDIDEAIRPDLAERQVRADEEQAITNRLYALIEAAKINPAIPRLNGSPDQDVCHAFREAQIAVSDAITEIAQSSLCWAAERRSGDEE